MSERRVVIFCFCSSHARCTIFYKRVFQQNPPTCLCVKDLEKRFEISIKCTFKFSVLSETKNESIFQLCDLLFFGVEIMV